MADKTFSTITVDNYDKEAQDAKMALLAFCAEKSGINSLETKADVINAFENVNFRTIFNSIIVDTLQSIILRSKPEQIWRLANVDEVEVGDSQTYEIDTKGLPIAQRTSYTTNVTFLDSHSKMSLTVTPKPYSIGTTMDYIRILTNNFDIKQKATFNFS